MVLAVITMATVIAITVVSVHSQPQNNSMNFLIACAPKINTSVVSLTKLLDLMMSAYLIDTQRTNMYNCCEQEMGILPY